MRSAKHPAVNVQRGTSFRNRFRADMDDHVRDLGGGEWLRERGRPHRPHEILATRPGVACQICARPPSTATSLAVMKLLSGDARKAATAPISAGSAMRWSGF